MPNVSRESRKSARALGHSLSGVLARRLILQILRQVVEGHRHGSPEASKCLLLGEVDLCRRSRHIDLTSVFDQVATPPRDLPHHDPVGLATSNTFDARPDLTLGHLATGLVQVGDRLPDDGQTFTFGPLATDVLLDLVRNQRVLAVPDLRDPDVHQHPIASSPRLLSVPTLTSTHTRTRTLQHHTNVGAMFRSAAGIGVDAVLVTPRCADPLYRRSVRVSMGTVFQVPWTRITDWPSSIDLLRDAGFVTASLALTDDAITLDELAAGRHERLALVLGSEGHGLKTSTIEASDLVVRIPMAGGVDSLNVAAASAVAFWATRT